ncbi:ChaN family lipoprotein [Vibrio japonicus]|uniref:ChaN family lipoprotein n=1 Tax=Vibrio japonicus TaxID=1824638 RepID=A0ABY5LJ05_9VIBR|nr:ChaN family lipoprotein [Vibrio japonicus]UUM29765.1 ChaN family lipoprotein [Vibrio japonicus]
MRHILTTSIFSMILAGCSATSQQSVSTFYDYQLYSPQATPINVHQLPESIKSADVILIGEWHTHSGIHRFQTDFLKSLSQQSNTIALSMEQFTRDKQAVVNEYLSGRIGEQMLIKNGNAWPNYESDYRPLIELAKSKNLDVIAANAPKPIVRCIGKEGMGYLSKLTPKERTFIAENIDTSSTPYKEKFMGSMHHGTLEQSENQYAAQVTWDETMAESITEYLKENPGNTVLHIAGKFHTEQGLGIKASILKRNPNLNVIVITPTHGMNTDIGQDFRLSVLELPIRYVQLENRKAAYQDLRVRNEALTCR